MKLLTAIVFLCSMIIGCAPMKVVTLQGHYPATPILDSSNKTVEKVWDNIIDLFSQNGLSIKIIDRSSGLIVSTYQKMSFTFEDNKGKMLNPNAYVVLEKTYPSKQSKLYYKPASVTGEWNIRIKTVGEKTLINVNLNNISAIYNQGYYSYSHIPMQAVVAEGRTTGNFEKMISDIVK